MEFPIVDYISISVPTPNLLKQLEISGEYNIPFDLDDRTYSLAELLCNQVNWREFPAKGIFKRHVQFLDIGVNYFEGHDTVSLVQFSGEGCEYLRNEGVLENVLLDWNDRFTRLDIAVDILCDVTPEDFTLTRSAPRFKLTERYDKNSGTTYYVGSRQSDRFARVYRYNHPHPRSDKLRIEYQLSDDQAKLISKRIIETSILQCATELGNTFGWLHKVYVPSLALGKAPSSRKPTGKGGTVFWLHHQVTPALRKIAEMGDIETLIGFESALKAIINEYYSERGH